MHQVGCGDGTGKDRTGKKRAGRENGEIGPMEEDKVSLTPSFSHTHSQTASLSLSLSSLSLAQFDLATPPNVARLYETLLRTPTHRTAFKLPVS